MHVCLLNVCVCVRMFNMYVYVRMCNVCVYVLCKKQQVMGGCLSNVLSIYREPPGNGA